MIDKAIVSYIDILGYASIVENHMEDIDLIHKFEQILFEASTGLKERIKEGIKSESLGGSELDEYTSRILELIKVRFISDTVLYILPISKITFSHPSFKENETISNCIYLYFNLIARFCTFFIGKTGRLLRGGISMGSHYENELSGGGNLFIFSEAYLNAYDLEKKAGNPRILIDERLWAYLENLSFDYMDQYFYKDEDERKCFNCYAWFRQDEPSQRFLSDISNALRANLTYNASLKKKKELSKIIYFARYHNIKIDELNFENLSIDTSTFEKAMQDS